MYANLSLELFMLVLFTYLVKTVERKGAGTYKQLYINEHIHFKSLEVLAFKSSMEVLICC